MAESSKPIVRNWTKEDIPGIIACHIAAYSDYPASMQFDERLYEMQLEAFPEGQFLAEIDGEVVGYCTSLIVQLDDNTHGYSYSEITGGYTFGTHEPAGDTLYGADIAVHPQHRGKRIASLLYEKRHALMRHYNLRRMVAYGRIPGYSAVAGKMTPEQYVKKVESGELKDSALNAHLRAGYKVKRVLLNFLPDDASLNYSTLLEMLNPDFNPARRLIAANPLKRPVRNIRVCCAQFYMRRIHAWDEFASTVDFFVDTAHRYHAHFLVLPELFTAQLFCLMPTDLETDEAMRRLANLHDRYLDLLREFAVDRGLYIIGGSTPVERDGAFYNVGHLFTPSGKIETQDKLHISPMDLEEWGFKPGEELRVFETPVARFAILLGYDIEFPELSRLLTLAGAEVLFVPFSADEKKAYDRLRYSAQARAVENYLYVALSGNVGNLPTFKNYLINYAQAAVLTPCDFAFPPTGVAGEAEPGDETMVIVDLDLNTLALQREVGTVRPFFARRADLYNLQAVRPIRVVRVD